MAIAPDIEHDDNESQNGRAVFGDKNCLYLVLDVEIDRDLLPQSADFSLVYDKQSVDIISIKSIFDDSQGTKIEFSLREDIESGKPAILSYQPSDWFMCENDSGDPVESFQERFIVQPLAMLGSSSSVAKRETADEQAVSTIDPCAFLRFLRPLSLQISFETQLDIMIAPRSRDFVIEQNGHALEIEEISYVKGNYGPDVHIALASPLLSGVQAVLTYESAENHLKTADSNLIAGFSLSAVVDADGGGKGVANEKPEESSKNETWAKLDSALIDVEANDSEIDPEADTPEDAELKEADAREAPKYHDVDQDLREVDVLFEEFEVEAQDAGLIDGGDPNTEQKEPQPVEASSSELSTLFRLVEESKHDNIEDAVLDRDIEASVDVIESVELIDELSSERQTSDQDDDLSAVGSEESAEQTEDEPEEQDEDVESSESALPTKPKAPMSLATKLIYLVPIVVFVWLLIVICVYVATMVFDFDLSISNTESKTENAAHSVHSANKSGSQDAQRESCRLEAPDGGVYEGHCVNGLRDGHGLYTWASGNRYVGEWSLDRQNGKGTLILTSGAVYEGEFRAGREHGNGKMTWPNGAWYEGAYEKGKFHGSGVYVSADGNRYEGVFKNGSMTKNGTCITKEGKSYFGPCNANAAASKAAE